VNVDWKGDNSGFYYSAISSPNRNRTVQKIFFYKLGTKQAEDQILYESADADELFAMNIVEGKYLLTSTDRADKELYSLRLKNLERPKAVPITRLTEQQHVFSYAGSRRNWLYFITNKRAPMSTLMAVKIGKKTVGNA